jgi:hypothetical protein
MDCLTAFPKRNLFVLMFLAAAIGSLPAPAEEGKWTDNLFLDGAGGFEKPTGEDSTAFGSIGVNLGLPILPNQDHNGVAWGLQLGGDIKFREDNPEYDITVGVFARNLVVRDQQAAVAMLMDYRHSAYHHDIFALRPIAGITLTKQDSIALTGVIGLNDDKEEFDNRIIRVETTDRIQAIWTREWTDRITTEFSGGYQFSDVDEGFGGAQIVYGLNKHMDVAVGGEINGNGNYSAGITFSYHVGGLGRHASVHNIRSSGAGFYTPFPKRSFPAMWHKTESNKPNKTRGTGGGGTGNDNGDGNGSGSGGDGGSGGTDDGSGNGGGGTDNGGGPGTGGGDTGSGGGSPGTGGNDSGNGGGGSGEPGCVHCNHSGGADGTNPGGGGNDNGYNNPGQGNGPER